MSTIREKLMDKIIMEMYGEELNEIKKLGIVEVDKLINKQEKHIVDTISKEVDIELLTKQKEYLDDLKAMKYTIKNNVLDYNQYIDSMKYYLYETDIKINELFIK